MKRTACIGAVVALACGVVLAAQEQPTMATNAPASAPATNVTVVMTTTLGTIEIELFAGKAPISVSNFLAYADMGFFDGTIFHRVIPGFMVQGGGFTANMAQKSTRVPIKNEADNGLKNERGTLAMARTSDINSATALGVGGSFTVSGGTIDNTSGAAIVMTQNNPLTISGGFAFSTAAGTMRAAIVRRNRCVSRQPVR